MAGHCCPNILADIHVFSSYLKCISEIFWNLTKSLDWHIFFIHIFELSMFLRCFKIIPSYFLNLFHLNCWLHFYNFFVFLPLDWLSLSKSLGWYISIFLDIFEYFCGINRNMNVITIQLNISRADRTLGRNICILRFQN